MTSEFRYLLDSNVFIEASRRYYSFNFGLQFWEFLEMQANLGTIFSIDKVLNEINEGDKKDPLRIWANKKFKEYFLSTKDEKVLEQYNFIINYVEN